MKSLFEQFKGIYRKENDYLIPNLEMPDTENFEIGIYGQQYLFFYSIIVLTYINLLTSGNLDEYLVKIDRQAQEHLIRSVEKMKQAQNIIEQLKANPPFNGQKS